MIIRLPGDKHPFKMNANTNTEKKRAFDYGDFLLNSLVFEHEPKPKPETEKCPDFKEVLD
jgi:hypothetical protein